tara:strand:- start:48 stop:500 length:453 start_codon:yes stop_codon:yes gene_type:complete
MARKSKVSEAMGEELHVQYEEEDEEEEVVKPPTKPLFDFNKYRVNTATEVKTLEVEGEEFDITVKPLSWSKKNQFLSKCLKWDSDGNTVFDGDAYVRLALQEMIINAPWGKTSEVFLISIDDRLGGALEKLVPQAFGNEVGAEVDNLKDE